MRLGIERETHRVTVDGTISRLPQPTALVPPFFTKDFAESQLEIVTRPHESVTDLVAELERLTATARAMVLPELLWPFSMPPRLPPDTAVRIASFGNGSKDRAAEIYRHGLALRYGWARQMICGVHVNVSITADEAAWALKISPLRSHESQDLYLRLARNLYADLAHIVLLTGASPVAGGLDTESGPRSWFVSVRNSSLGYAGSEFRPYLDLRSLAGYVSGIREGMRTESERFQPLGLARDGRLLQLNMRVFQKEKEFYAPVRLKRTGGQSDMLRTMEREGIEYVELRFLDVDPFHAVGIGAETLRVLGALHRGRSHAGLRLRAPSGS